MFKATHLSGFSAQAPSIDSNTLFLLRSGSETNGSTTFGNLGKAVCEFVPYGGVAHSTTQAKFGTSSIRFDGVDDRFVINIGADMSLGSGSFTLESWVRTAAISQQLIPFRYIWMYGVCHIIDTDYSIMLLFSNDGGTWTHSAVSATNVIVPNVWQHQAIVRNGNTLSMYVNGVSVCSTAVSGSLASADSQTLRIGGETHIEYLNGYMEEFRISNIARYTTGFTPPSSPF